MQGDKIEIRIPVTLVFTVYKLNAGYGNDDDEKGMQMSDVKAWIEREFKAMNADDMTAHMMAAAKNDGFSFEGTFKGEPSYVSGDFWDIEVEK